MPVGVAVRQDEGLGQRGEAGGGGNAAEWEVRTG